MKNILKVIFILLAISSLSEAKWKALKSLKYYANNGSFNLKNGVKYLEIRAYIIGEKSKTYKILFSTSRQIYKNIKKNVRKRFEHITPIYSSKSNLKLERGSYTKCKIIYNAFVIMDNDKILKMNMQDDVLSFLGDIDTDGEFRLMMWLRNYDNNIRRYKQTLKGFEAIEWERPMLGEGKCIDKKYQLFLDKKLNIIHKKLLQTKKTKRDCISCLLEAPRECK